MNERTINYFNYYTEIEEFFVLKRGKHILLAPLDWTLVEAWQDMGIPLHVVIRGIDRAMDFFTARQTRHRFVNSLFYCNQAVLEEFEQHLLSLAGAGAAKPTGPEGAEIPAVENLPVRKVRAFIANLQAELGRARSNIPSGMGQEMFDRLQERLKSLVMELDATPGDSAEKLNHDLKTLDDLLVPYLESCLTAAEIDEIRRNSKLELKTYKKNLKKEMYDRILKNYFRKKIKAHFQISDFSLLGLE